METLSNARTQSWLSWFFRGLLILSFVILLGRIFELQIIKGGYYKELSEGNRVRRIPISAPRGQILARGGEILVGSKKVKKRIIFDPTQGFEKIDDLSGATEDEIVTEYVRQYPLGAAFGHVSGYLGEANENEVGKINPNCPQKGPRTLGILVGRSGLEEEYECTLSGIDGDELVEVDATGKKVRVLGRKEPIAGSDIKTNIDYNLQKKVAEIVDIAEDIPEDRKVAVVVSDPKGEVLSLYSSPSFDPGLFIEKGKDSEVKDLLENPNLPFLNRVTSGSFHPGSVFKPVTAVAALEEGKIDKGFTFIDTGVIEVNGFRYTNWYFTQYGGTEGEIGLVRAITRSTDTFFYKVGEILGVDKLADWAEKFGLGEKTGIDLPGEALSLIPTPEWKEKIKGERWFLGNTYNMAIGQGDVAVTPIALNSAIAALAANGLLCTPRLFGEGGCSDLKIDRNNIDLVKEGMKGACTQGGTGFTFFGFSPQVACKTGTAETSQEDTTHAWFTAFAPSDFPEIVATVLVENGGEGAYAAGPIARSIFDFYFHQSE